ncbi:Aste57867_10396 [Aphanomyces stellatus]|uniref:Aste57867_10396 protein n=1 Tax=Aphanomyces stellatus TaxID=120398 RepID=A0A485KQC0_9STRA|nr:hypothetical protein As57867_010356 [Aphanomyces stellatus]VFT87270.1 Aste57867_10396 [Aphanomyces stellatus]
MQPSPVTPAEDAGEVIGVKGSIHEIIPYISSWLTRWSKMTPFDIEVVNGENVTKEWVCFIYMWMLPLEEVGFSEPFVVLEMETIGLRVPTPSFGVDDIKRIVGLDTIVPVVHVASQQEIFEWSIERWSSYFITSPAERTDIFEVVNFDFGVSPALSNLVSPPSFVSEFGWIETLWPKTFKFPVQKLCVMSAKDSFTDFHINSGGASLWYTVARGKKIFYLIPPTTDNLNQFKGWRKNSKGVSFGEIAGDGCQYVIVNEGSTIVLPSGWIYAISTSEDDAIAFKGYFLHGLGLDMQLRCHNIEVEVNGHCLFPKYESILWLVACWHLSNKQKEDVDLTSLLRVLKPSKEANEIAQEKGFTSADSVLRALKSTLPSDSSDLDESGDDSESDNENSDSSMTSNASDVDLAYPKFKKENVKSEKYPLKVLTPLVIPKMEEIKPISTPKHPTPKQKRKSKQEVEEQWYFECRCGQKGSNYDDGKRMVQCETCSTWQHTHCAGIPNDSDPPSGYTCFKCNQVAQPSVIDSSTEWTVSCSCGIVAKNFDDGCRMIACDACNTWQHTLCAGIPNESEPPDAYVCRACKNVKKAKAVKSPKAMKSPKAVKSPKIQVVRKTARKAHSSSEDDTKDDEEEETPSYPKRVRSTKRTKVVDSPSKTSEIVRPPIKIPPQPQSTSKPKKQPTSVRERLVKKLKMKPKWGRM